MIKTGNLYQGKILTDSAEMFAAETTRMMSNFMVDLALNNPSEMLLIQFKDSCQDDIDMFIDSHFRRVDNQYLYHGDFIYRWDLEKLISPYCKEICISVAPKGPEKAGKHIDTREQCGYLTIATIAPFMAGEYKEVE